MSRLRVSLIYHWSSTFIMLNCSPYFGSVFEFLKMFSNNFTIFDNKHDYYIFRNIYSYTNPLHWHLADNILFGILLFLWEIIWVLLSSLWVNFRTFTSIRGRFERLLQFVDVSRLKPLNQLWRTFILFSNFIFIRINSLLFLWDLRIVIQVVAIQEH